MKSVLLLALFLSAALVVSAQQTDQDWFGILYQKISDIVSPQEPLSGGDDGTIKIAAPHQLFLMETPGVAIAREDFDAKVWQAEGFINRSPSYVLADFVDRAPRYTDVTFVDTGARVSQIWKVLMTQYLVPVIDDPVQTAAVDKAREKLFGENSTLQEDFDEAWQVYAEAFTSSLAAREQCVFGPDPNICTQALLLPEQTLANAWFSMETRRRDLLGAQAAVLALQMMDLKTLYAEALQKFSRSKRVDVGATSFGDEFYQTYANPSDFWEWWKVTPNRYSWVISRYGGEQQIFMHDVINGINILPATGGGQEPVSSADIPGLWDGTDLQINPTTVNNTITWTLQSTTIAFGSPAVHTDCMFFDGSTMGPQAGCTSNTAQGGGFNVIPAGPGSAAFTLTYKIGTSDERVFSYTVFADDEMTGSQRAAFSQVEWYQGDYSSSAQQSTSSLSVSASVRVRVGLFSGSGNFNYGSSSSSSSSSSATSDSRTKFSVARVNIVRPWLDTNLMTFKPVAIRGVPINGWSRGPVMPTADNAKLRFPLLPTAFIVVRDVELTMSFSSTFASASAKSTSYSASVRIKYGPFFSGSSSVSSSKTNAKQSSGGSYSGGSLKIEGPQVIGWVCTVLPAFPTASSVEMEKMNFGQQLTNTFEQV